MKYFPFLILITSCSVFPPKPSNELEAITEEVLKKKEGVEIEITPIQPVPRR